MKSQQNELNESLKKRLNITSNDEQQQIIKHKFQLFLQKWLQVKDLISNLNFNSIEYIYKGNCDKYIVDGSQYKFNIPESIMLEYGHAIKNVNKNKLTF